MSLRRRLALVTVLLLGLVPAAARANESLGLHGGRFRVTADWRLADGTSGRGQATALTAESGYFWFFTPTNVELVVKVIDACQSYDRFWVMGSGLTNVGVTINVEDAWTGESRQYHHAGGPLFLPFADTATFDGCAAPVPACGQGARADLDASPRLDLEAEELALLLGDAPVAPTALYDRLRTDLAAIRALDPLLAQPGFHNIWWDSHGLFLDLTPAAFAAVKAGAYEEWDCLNAWYGATVEHVYDYSPTVLMGFTPRLHPYRLGEDYEALAGVVHSSANGYGWPSGGPPPTPGLCAIAGPAGSFDYFLEAAPGQHHYRVTAPGAAPTLIGVWDFSQPQPAWFPRLEQCYTELELRAGP